MAKQSRNDSQKRCTKKSIKDGSGTEATKNKKRGAESQYANKVKPYLADIERYVRCGVTEGQICEFYGVGKTAWAAYKKRYPEINETLYRAQKALKIDLINRAYDVAMGYDYIETTTVEIKDEQGNVTGMRTTTYNRHAKADGNMIQFLLINRFSDEYARDPQTIELRKKALQLAEQGQIPPDDMGSI